MRKQFTIFVLALACLPCLAAPLPIINIKECLALGKQDRSALYADLKLQWDASNDQEKEDFRKEMRKQLDGVPVGERLQIIGELLAIHGQIKSK